MFDYYTITYLSRTVHIIKAKADSSHDVQMSIMADKYDTPGARKLASNFSDSYLESNGWSRVGVVNGGIFNPQYAPIIYANGIEKAFWNVNENDDSELNGVMALCHTGDTNNLPIIELQSAAKANLDSYRGGITVAFGLLKNGVENKGSWIQGIPTKKSGRTIVGKDSGGTIYLISSAGVSPTVENPDGIGLTGQNCIDLCISLGLTDAVALDGGGSCSLIYQGDWKVSTSRLIKNAIGLYVKQKSTPVDPEEPGETPSVTRVRDTGFLPLFDEKIPHKAMYNGFLCSIKEILVMKNGILVPINELQKGSS